MESFKKFEDIKYARPDVEKRKRENAEYVAAFTAADSYETARRLFLEEDKAEQQFSTMFNVAYIRYTGDTRDEFYNAEVEYFDEQEPYLQLAAKEKAKALLASPYREQFAAEFGEDLINSARAAIRLSDESIVEEQIACSKLEREYTQITSACSVNFMGEDCNFYGLLKYMEDPSRQVRRDAYLQWAKLYEGISDKLNDIYIKMVGLRKSMAKKLGFKNYAEMAYMQNSHYYYGADEVAAFRKQVVDEIVPLAAQIYKEQEARLGVDKLRYYDENLTYKEGNAQPEGSEEQMIKAAAQMYGEMSPETGEFFSFMTEHHLFDLTTRAGKSGGGYCTFLESYSAPFIFSNFNGTSADVDVLTHEAGHAFQAYLASRIHPLSMQVWSTNEVSEIHSQTMELFAYPYMEKFFGENADKYRFAHFTVTIKTVPYLCLVDHFQHEVYAQENLSGEKLAEIWRNLEKVYMPWRDYDGVGFLEKGGFWMQKQHIFLNPFYYVDYALAQMGAFEYYLRYLNDKQGAWADYLKLCRSGGSKPYFETLKEGNLSNPFSEGSVKAITDGLRQALKNF